MRRNPGRPLPEIFARCAKISTLPRGEGGVVCGVLLVASLLWPAVARAEDGYDLWLRYRPVEKEWIAPYRAAATNIVVAGASPTITAARDELERGLAGMLGRDVPETD